MPDFEIDLGLLPDLELDVDGAWAWEGGATSALVDHSAPDNLWVSLKLGLVTLRDDDGAPTWSFGLQAGPKLPAAPGSEGVGAEAILLIGRAVGPAHLVLDLGAKVDPDAGGGRPQALEGGLTVDLDLDAAGRYSLDAALAGTGYFSSDPTEASASLGLTFAATPALDLSLTVVVGFTAGSDHAAVLLGVSPKVSLWTSAR